MPQASRAWKSTWPPACCWRCHPGPWRPSSTTPRLRCLVCSSREGQHRHPPHNNAGRIAGCSVSLHCLPAHVRVLSSRCQEAPTRLLAQLSRPGFCHGITCSIALGMPL
ncbi:hypothetical protein MTO96_019518 [Rhipicephalus appendiculatus]